MENLKITINGIHIATFFHVPVQEAREENIKAGWWMDNTVGIAGALKALGRPYTKSIVFSSTWTKEGMHTLIKSAINANIILVSGRRSMIGTQEYFEAVLNDLHFAAERAGISQYYAEVQNLAPMAVAQ